MRIVGMFLVSLLAVPASGQERLVLPPQLETFAKAHHCKPVSEFVTDEESSQATPFDLSYEFHHGPPKTLLAAWEMTHYSIDLSGWRRSRDGVACRTGPRNVRRLGAGEITYETQREQQIKFYRTWGC